MQPSTSNVDPRIWYFRSVPNRSCTYVGSLELDGQEHGRTKDSFFFFLLLARSHEPWLLHHRTGRQFRSHRRTTQPCRPPPPFRRTCTRGPRVDLDGPRVTSLSPSLRPRPRACTVAHALPIKPAPHHGSNKLIPHSIPSHPSAVQFPSPTPRPGSMASSSSSVLLGGGAGAAALTAAAGKALPAPCFLAARPRAVSAGRLSLSLQTAPRSSPVCTCAYMRFRYTRNLHFHVDYS